MVGIRDRREPPADIDDHLRDELDRWLQAEVITADQAEAIRQLERARVRQASAAGRIPLVAEALGFLGGSLAAIAGIVATSRFWDHFATGTRLVLVGGVAALLIVAGVLVRRGDDPALDHLGSFLWLVATGAAAFWGGVLANDVFDWTGPDIALVVGCSALVVAGGLWWWRAAPLQHLATLAALAITVGGVAGQVEHVGGTDTGIALWALGVTWAVLGWLDVVRPTQLAYALGAVLAIGGSIAVASQSNWGDALAVGTALALLAASVPARSMVLLWAGVAGVFESVPSTIFEHLGDSASVPVALFLAGAALIAVAIVASRLVREVRAAPPKPPRLDRRTIAAGMLAAVATVTGLTVGITQAQVRAVPAFASLRTTPDPSLEGTVAFLRRSGDEPCLYVIPASGARAEQRRFCNTDLGDDVTWNDAGNVVVIQYVPTGEPQAVEVSPRTGRVISRSNAGDIARFKEKGFLSADQTRASDGAVLEVVDRADGRALLRTRVGSAPPRTVFATRGPRDYAFRQAAWSGDGRFALVTDSEQRLLVVDVEASSARILVRDASGAAWSK